MLLKFCPPPLFQRKCQIVSHVIHLFDVLKYLRHESLLKYEITHEILSGLCDAKLRIGILVQFRGMYMHILHRLPRLQEYCGEVQIVRDTYFIHILPLSLLLYSPSDLLSRILARLISSSDSNIL